MKLVRRKTTAHIISYGSASVPFKLGNNLQGFLAADYVNICSGINWLNDEVQEEKDQV